MTKLRIQQCKLTPNCYFVRLAGQDNGEALVVHKQDFARAGWDMKQTLVKLAQKYTKWALNDLVSGGGNTFLAKVAKINKLIAAMGE